MRIDEIAEREADRHPRVLLRLGADQARDADLRVRLFGEFRPLGHPAFELVERQILRRHNPRLRPATRQREREREILPRPRLGALGARGLAQDIERAFGVARQSERQPQVGRRNRVAMPRQQRHRLGILALRDLRQRQREDRVAVRRAEFHRLGQRRARRGEAAVI